MKNTATQTANTAKTAKLKNAKPLSKEQLETITGGPISSRGTVTNVQH